MTNSKEVGIHLEVPIYFEYHYLPLEQCSIQLLVKPVKPVVHSAEWNNK